jgi:arylsulfatase A-like enzyme
VPPNVLLVVFDALRRDAVEPYGAPPGATPAIAELAARGAALPNAYATASWTLPSHASMFTGLLPRQLGLAQPPAGTPQSARPQLERVADRVLARVLASCGYTTRGWSANLWASHHAGFDIGFDQFSYLTGQRIDRLAAEGPRARVAWALEGLRATRDDGATQIGAELRDAIERWSGSPAFWFVNLCECHSPYLPPRPWDDLGAQDRIRAALEAQRHLSFQSICLFAAGRWQIPNEAFARMRHLYARAASYLDQWLAGVLDALSRRGILDQTLVIITSDHGENFGEDGLIAHGFSLDQRLIHVPLVLAGPGAISKREPFSLAELPRVIANAAGLGGHPWREQELPQGIAVSQYDPMAPPSDARVRDFAERWRLDDTAVRRLTAAFTSATDGELKLVLRDGDQLLYDLRSDPDERSPIDARAMNGRFDRLRAALEHPSVTASGSSEPDATAAPSASADELAALERQMKLLGYM